MYMKVRMIINEIRSQHNNNNQIIIIWKRNNNSKCAKICEKQWK